MPISQIMPSGGSWFRIGGAAAGFFTNGPIGALLGGAVAHIVDSGARTVGNYIRNGTGAVVHSVKSLFASVKNKICDTIYYLVASIPQWLIMKIENTEAVKKAFVSADEAYLAKCRTATYEVNGQAKSMRLDDLFVPMEGGCAEDSKVVDALVAQSVIAEEQAISKAQIQNWVALGERIYVALSTDDASQVANGYVVVQDAKGEDVVVESSVYNGRALMWYFAAQAVKGELVKQKVLKMNQFRPSPAEIQTIASNCLKAKDFVVPDKDGKVFRFLEKARVEYHDSSDLLPKASALRGGNNAIGQGDSSIVVHVIDDASGYLPNGAKRMEINPLMPVDGKGGRQIAFRLADFTNPSLLGRTEEHEPLAVRMAKGAMAVPAKMVAAVADLKPEDPEKPRVGGLEERRAAFFKKLMGILDEIKKDDAGWKYNRDHAAEAMEAKPLHQLLPYLIFPDHAKDRDTNLDVLKQIGVGERDQLKQMAYRILQEGIEAEGVAQLARGKNEIFIMPHILGKEEVENYWNEQVSAFEENLFAAVFNTRDRKAEIEEREQWMLARWIEGSPVDNLAKIKKRELELYKAARREIVKDAVEERRTREVNARITAQPVTLETAVEGSLRNETIEADWSVVIKPALTGLKLKDLIIPDYGDSIDEFDENGFADAVDGEIEFDEEGFADAIEEEIDDVTSAKSNPGLGVDEGTKGEISTR